MKALVAMPAILVAAMVLATPALAKIPTGNGNAIVGTQQVAVAPSDKELPFPSDLISHITALGLIEGGLVGAMAFLFSPDPFSAFLLQGRATGSEPVGETGFFTVPIVPMDGGTLSL